MSVYICFETYHNNSSASTATHIFGVNESATRAGKRHENHGSIFLLLLLCHGFTHCSRPLFITTWLKCFGVSLEPDADLHTTFFVLVFEYKRRRIRKVKWIFSSAYTAHTQTRPNSHLIWYAYNTRKSVDRIVCTEYTGARCTELSFSLYRQIKLNLHNFQLTYMNMTHTRCTRVRTILVCCMRLSFACAQAKESQPRLHSLHRHAHRTCTHTHKRTQNMKANTANNSGHGDGSGCAHQARRRIHIWMKGAKKGGKIQMWIKTK